MIGTINHRENIFIPQSLLEVTKKEKVFNYEIFRLEQRQESLPAWENCKGFNQRGVFDTSVHSYYKFFTIYNELCLITLFLRSWFEIKEHFGCKGCKACKGN